MKSIIISLLFALIASSRSFADNSLPLPIFLEKYGAALHVTFTLEKDKTALMPGSAGAPLECATVAEPSSPLVSVADLIACLQKYLPDDYVTRDIKYPSVVHLIDKTLTVDSLDATLAGFDYHGPLYLFPDELGKRLNGKVLTQHYFYSDDHPDFGQIIDLKFAAESAREMLTEADHIDSQNCINWTAQRTTIGKVSATYVFFNVAANPNH